MKTCLRVSLSTFSLLFAVSACSSSNASQDATDAAAQDSSDTSDAPATPSADLVTSTQSDRWHVQTAPDVVPYDGTTTNLVDVDPTSLEQEIDGFGGCFNELGWNALTTLDDATRDSVVASLFGADGCNFNLARSPIGASDYATSWYSLDETANDWNLDSFSIDRDRKALLPYIQAAMTHRPDLRVWGSAWSPPQWLKDNGNYAGGHLLTTDQAQTTYAHYLSKYVQAYRAEGVHLYAVHVQNEPYAEQVFPSCAWDAATMRDFIKNHLGPQFRDDGLDAEIWLGTINNGSYAACAGVVLSDPAASAFVKGVGYQWAGKDAIATTSAKNPDKRLMQTETECGTGTNDWTYAQYTFDLFRWYLERGANAYMQWNMVLDETGTSSWGWKQSAMITVNRKTHAVTYNPQFHLVQHVTHFVAPGAHRIDSTSDWAERLVFLDPNGDVVVVLANTQATDADVTIKIGDRMVQATIPGTSFDTFVVHGAAGAN